MLASENESMLLNESKLVCVFARPIFTINTAFVSCACVCVSLCVIVPVCPLFILFVYIYNYIYYDYIMFIWLASLVLKLFVCPCVRLWIDLFVCLLASFSRFHNCLFAYRIPV